MKIVQLSPSELTPYANNARTHSDKQIDMIIASISEFGFTNPLLIDESNLIIAGHGRLQAAIKLGLDKVPTITLTGLTDAQKKAYVIADNQLAMNSGWNMEMLKVELDELKLDNFDIDVIGFDKDFLNDLFDEQSEGLTDEDAVPEVEASSVVSVRGDVWILGHNRVMCGDSTMVDDIEKLTLGEKAQLLHADPPYGMGKEGDGVENDNLYNEKLDKFQMDWWTTFRTSMADNASAYIWGNSEQLWRLWYNGGLADSERLTLRNDILWEQEGVSWGKDGMAGLRQFANMGEHCLFFMLGEQGFNNNSDNYWEGWEGIRSYLANEMDRCGWTTADLNRITGTKMASHWVTKSQWGLITPGHYAKIQAAARDHDAFKRDHDELKRDHDELKREFYATRAYFDSGHDQMSDVWRFDRVKGSERHGHATPKPVAMMERVMKSSLPPKGLCLEPFGGSGSTLMGAEKSGRRCFTMELQPFFCDVIIKRWQNFTGMEAIHENGRSYNSMKAQEVAA